MLPPKQSVRPRALSYAIRTPKRGEGPLVARSDQALPFHSQVCPLSELPVVPPNRTVTPRWLSKAIPYCERGLGPPEAMSVQEFETVRMPASLVLVPQGDLTVA